MKVYELSNGMKYSISKQVQPWHGFTILKGHFYGVYQNKPYVTALEPCNGKIKVYVMDKYGIWNVCLADIKQHKYFKLLIHEGLPMRKNTFGIVKVEGLSLKSQIRKGKCGYKPMECFSQKLVQDLVFAK